MNIWMHLCAESPLHLHSQNSNPFFFNTTKLSDNRTPKSANHRDRLSIQIPSDNLLKPPEHDTLHLISPPGSPPIGWEQVLEEPPNAKTLADDLEKSTFILDNIEKAAEKLKELVGFNPLGRFGQSADEDTRTKEEDVKLDNEKESKDLRKIEEKVDGQDNRILESSASTDTAKPSSSLKENVTLIVPTLSINETSSHSDEYLSEPLNVSSAVSQLKVPSIKLSDINPHVEPTLPVIIVQDFSSHHHSATNLSVSDQLLSINGGTLDSKSFTPKGSAVSRSSKIPQTRMPILW
ncbi:hypothetical protein BKA69DRAFT_1084352 [Paraphysoderma sedebokerense]|nr:hypothetical protein BKA69DRAFT_1084352 [Paraphysoderma sedebokerense]